MNSKDTWFKRGQPARNKKPSIEKACKSCGKIFYVRPSWDRVRACSVSCGQKGRKNKFKGKTLPWKDKLRGERLHVRGESNHKWIEDRTKLAKFSNGNEYRNSPAHREWSGSVKNRDGWKCKISNSDCSGQVVAHHILGWKDYPELRYNINNGITLCHSHHPMKREEEKRLSPYFQALVSASKN